MGMRMNIFQVCMFVSMLVVFFLDIVMVKFYKQSFIFIKSVLQFLGFNLFHKDSKGHCLLREYDSKYGQ
ncbi:hypothetical protein L6452_22536 [Arctium lappa]|uniref:Uncharacterized protein n=1 Tax=Arctium lappa TaxID=4217 RepID=A0ACB9B034_ARCLA|nr:hypothetical protein L6452_22536 [Arctium lappa]